MPGRSEEEYRQWVKGLVLEIETSSETEREREGREVLARRPRGQGCRSIRRAFYEAFSLFLAAYREAAEELREGVKEVVFPEGCFPPTMPYVPYPDLGPRPP